MCNGCPCVYPGAPLYGGKMKKKLTGDALGVVKVNVLGKILYKAKINGFDFDKIKEHKTGLIEYFVHDKLTESALRLVARGLENVVIFDRHFLETLDIRGWYCPNCEKLCKTAITLSHEPQVISQCCEVEVVYLNSKEHPKRFLQQLVVCDEPVLVLGRLLGYDDEK